MNANESRHSKAVRLVAEDELTDVQIAAELGVHVTTLERWKRKPEFQADVQAMARVLEAETYKFAIAKRRNRVKALDDRWKRLQRVIEQRADALSMQEVPGGDTGLLTRTVKIIGTGQNQQRIEEFAVDTGALKELRDHEKQAAQEIGQWTDKSEQKLDMIVREYVGVDPDEV